MKGHRSRPLIFVARVLLLFGLQVLDLPDQPERLLRGGKLVQDHHDAPEPMPRGPGPAALRAPCARAALLLISYPLKNDILQHARRAAKARLL